MSGAIFLGSPHLVGDKKDAKRVIDLLLRCQHKGYDRRSASGDIDAESLLEICKGFERTNLAVPVVSIFEAKHTSTPRSVFSKAKIWKKAQYEAVVSISFLSRERKCLGAHSLFFLIDRAREHRYPQSES